jgi:LPXTG-motif cell wall-anchored protein
MRHPVPHPTRLACLALALLVGLALPATVLAHAELEVSTPADGATVPSPFDGPITISFSAALADGSKADLQAADGTVVASATVDGPGAAMTIALDSPLDPGDYEVRWVSVADDGDLERGTITFTVAPPVATPSPATSPSPIVAPSGSAAQPASPAASASPSAEPSPTPEPDTGSTTDVVVPIVVALLALALGAVYLFSRRRPAAG